MRIRGFFDFAWFSLLGGVLVINLFLGAGDARWPQLFFGGVGLVDQQKLQQSLPQLYMFEMARRIGHSFRVALGSRLSWVIWQDGSPVNLFFADELKVGRGLAGDNPSYVINTAQKIASVAERLKKEGYELIVVPVPTKLSIESEYVQWPIEFSSVTYAPIQIYAPILIQREDRSNEVYKALAERLSSLGVPVVDLQTTFTQYKRSHPGARLYPPGESHWNQLGILVAARETASVLRHLMGLPELPKFTFDSRLEVIEADIARGFDVSRFWPGALKTAYWFEDSIVVGVNLEKEVKREPLAIVGVGTSYSGQYWGMGGTACFPYLTGALMAADHVANAANAGMGSHYSMQRFIDAPEQIDGVSAAKKFSRKVVVWEFPIRDIMSIADLLQLPAVVTFNPSQGVATSSTSTPVRPPSFNSSPRVK